MRTNKDWKCCDKSNGEQTIIEMPKGIHYAKAICKHCGHFIKWLPNPNITKVCEERNTKIDKIILCNPNMDDRKKSFLISLKSIRFPTLKQLSFYNDIENKYPLD